MHREKEHWNGLKLCCYFEIIFLKLKLRYEKIIIKY